MRLLHINNTLLTIVMLSNHFLPHPHLKPLQVLISSMNSFAAIVALLMLFWLVFSIVGLHVFGGLNLAPPAWPNCDTLVNSGILNFHVGAGNA